MRAWTEYEIEFLKSGYADGISIKELSEKISRSPAAIRNKAYEQGITENKSWSDTEIRLLTEEYARADANPPLDLKGLADRLGRPFYAVAMKASKMGITDNCRKKVAARKDRRKFKCDIERSRAASERQKKWIEKNGHPRGMAGKKHSEETKIRLRKTSLAANLFISDEEKSRRVEKAMKTKIDKKGSIAPHRPNASWKSGWREIGAKRHYFRSRWEANYARYLQWLKDRGEIHDWQYEPETFWFEQIKRGVRSYLPDFRVFENDGSKPLHEVKGWMDARSKTTLRRMAKYHPQETIILIRERDYNSIARQVSRLIEGWEYSERPGRW